jgi:DNA-binding LytR/AlgR family response regulator
MRSSLNCLAPKPRKGRSRNAVDDGDPFSAIFLDVRMPPGIDGYEAAERIRKLDPSVHIVIVTGYSDYTYEDFLEIAGPPSQLTYMPKPVWPDQLRNVAQILSTERKDHRVQLGTF